MPEQQTEPQNNMSEEEIYRLESKRLQFYEAAEPLFERFGYKKTTVEEVCRDAGASKRTFYELFRDKADLAQNLMLHVAYKMFDGFYRKRQLAGSATEKLELLIEEYVRMGRKHKIFHTLIKDLDLLSTIGEHKNDLQFSHTIEAMKQILEEGMANGEFRQLDSDAVTWMIYSQLDSMYYLIPEYAMGPGAFEDQHLAREVHDFLLHAIVHPDRAGSIGR